MHEQKLSRLSQLEVELNRGSTRELDSFLEKSGRSERPTLIDMKRALGEVSVSIPEYYSDGIPQTLELSWYHDNGLYVYCEPAGHVTQYEVGNPCQIIPPTEFGSGHYSAGHILIKFDDRTRDNLKGISGVRVELDSYNPVNHLPNARLQEMREGRS